MIVCFNSTTATIGNVVDGDGLEVGDGADKKLEDGDGADKEDVGNINDFVVADGLSFNSFGKVLDDCGFVDEMVVVGDVVDGGGLDVDGEGLDDDGADKELEDDDGADKKLEVGDGADKELEDDDGADKELEIGDGADKEDVGNINDFVVADGLSFNSFGKVLDDCGFVDEMVVVGDVVDGGGLDVDGEGLDDDGADNEDVGNINDFVDDDDELGITNANLEVFSGIGGGGGI
ncbi:hypothetical protein PPL_11145 [Heterostelium album PN500]|uniref:Uncharacterized protein n=1 Tax=Heterostelium pallidum (strain ATCC 26659 / Pp 5 / PN500) TaxID=670386 RepID=D3BTN5_HETP5|nr:hypothetical protein PPL_11145 [Heterostelium album PN500]EFA75071.1 hypothetical protein PPL_11145 [Heterostelium album PN500]|eukprot:XP_020427205.1 hypothetical protein PPL_11145 [Heterostelium album PN500]